MGSASKINWRTGSETIESAATFPLVCSSFQHHLLKMLADLARKMELYGLNSLAALEEGTQLEDGTLKLLMSIGSNKVLVTVTKKAKAVTDWIESQRGRVFGLDVEWRPNLPREQHPVALLQLSSERECLLVQMLYLDSIPSSLIQFLKNPTIRIAGVGIEDDINKLKRDYDLICEGSVELGQLAAIVLQNGALRKMGLKGLARTVLGYDMNKDKLITCSDWSQLVLTREQIVYGCIDAWVSFALVWKLGKYV